MPNNFNIFSDILGFLNDDKNVFILNGFIGSGKSYFLNFTQNFLYSKVLVFKFNCYEATTLDDILLSFYTDFIDYHNKHKNTLPKVSSPVFSDKINAYIKSCINPILIIIDSFENLSDKNKIDVINFINYLAKFDKIKIFIGARNFDESFLSKDVKFSEDIMKILDKGFLNELLAQNEININFFKSEEIYKYSKGHYIYISIIIIILSVLKISVDNLFDEFSRKNTVFFDFLISKLLSLAPDSFLKPLWFLSVIRHGISEKFLIENNFISKEDIYYLEQKMILYREFDLLYLKDYIKNVLSKTLEPVTKVKIHNFYIHIYESQLPKKPSERDLLISRDTMRKELEYHKKFIENSKLINPQVHKTQVKEVDFSYLSYSKTVGHDWTFPKNELEIKNVPAVKIKNASGEKFELSKEELALLNSSSDNPDEASMKILNLRLLNRL